MTRSLLRAFTLLELLVVIAILATVGGGMLVAYDGLEAQAAKGQATNTIASLDNSVRAFTVARRTAPNNLDTLIAADATDVTAGSEVLAILGSKIAGKFTITPLTAAQVDSLAAAGITDLRYVDIAGNDVVADGTGPTFTLNAPSADGSAGVVGYIDQIDIPNRVFDLARPGSNNRGRGFVAPRLDPGGGTGVGFPVMVWNPGSGGINLSKVGANAGGLEGTAGSTYADGGADTADVLIGLAVGNNCTLVNENTDDSIAVGEVRLANAPFYSDVPPNTYSRYVLLYNVGSLTNPRSKAKLQAVIDARGDFLDEEFAEYTGQKQ